MSHEFETGMFARGLKAWHGLGKVLPEGHAAERDAMDALRAASLDWSVSMQPVLATIDGTGFQVPVPGVRAIVRDTDKRILGNAGDVPRAEARARENYVPMQNADVAKWFQPVLDAGEARIEAAASLFGGQRVYMLARIGHNGDSKAEVVEGDTVVNHWLLANDHSGKHSLRVARCRTRVVCANTLAAAYGEGTYVRIRHSRNMADTLDALQAIMVKERDAFTHDVGIFRELAKKQVTKASLRTYIEAVFPESFKEKKETAEEKRIRERQEQRDRWQAERMGKDLVSDILGASAPMNDLLKEDSLVSEILERVEVLMENGRGTDVPGVRGTAWGAYNAVAEYLQYEHGRGPNGATDKRMDAMLFGQPATWNALALQKAMEFGR